MVNKQKPNYLGKHLLIEFWNCTISENLKIWKQILWKAAEKANSTPLKFAIQKFEPQGLTAVVILAESHISIHTWPEKKYIAIDIFTCGSHTNPLAAMEYLKQELTPEKIEYKFLNRGKEKYEQIQ